MWFEIYKKGKLIKRGSDILGDFDWDNELMDVPSTQITLPITYTDYLSGREEIKIFINDKCFWGIVTDLNVDKESETVDVDIDHVISEWEYRQISINNAIKTKAINVIYKEEDKKKDNPTVQDQLKDIYDDTNFAYPGWTLNMPYDVGNVTIDYVYSRQTKLEALNKTMELTPDIFWRVRFVNEKVLDIDRFGEKKNYILSKKPTGPNNIQILGDPEIDFDFANVINLATVYSEKSDSGMSSMTLREVYNDTGLQLDGFPCVILRENVNNERDYKRYVTQYPTLAPNNELEYAVLDEESIAMEGGTVIEGTFAFNDLSPFEVKDKDGKTKEVTDKDRIEAAKTAYYAAVRNLRQKRRRVKIKVDTEELPADINVGDRVRFIYDNSIYVQAECSNYMKKILHADDWFYITHISYNFGINGYETDSVTLEKFLYIDRETQ